MAFADGELAKVELVSPSYAGALSGASLYGFTPMNFETDERYGGQSVKPNINENGTFSVILNAENVQALSTAKDYALKMWIYFPSTSIFNLSITLSGQNSLSEDGSLNYVITSDALTQMLAKPSDSLHSQDLETDGYGWNYLEIPFSAFSKINATEGPNYIEFNAITLNYNTSSELSSGALLFYNIAIEESAIVNPVIKEENKQPYRLFKVDANLDFSSVFLGDQLTLPAKSVAVKYAYIGETNVLTNTADYSIEARVLTSETDTAWEWSGVFTFNTEGANTVKFFAKNKDSNRTELLKLYSFGVYDFVGLSIYQNITTFYVGQKIAIYANASTKLTDFSNLHFEIVGDSAKIISENATEKYVIIEIVKEGNFKLVATANGARKYDDSIALSAEKSFVAKAQNDNKRGVKIAMWIAFGLVASLGIGFGIKAIIDANKYSVR